MAKIKGTVCSHGGNNLFPGRELTVPNVGIKGNKYPNDDFVSNESSLFPVFEDVAWLATQFATDGLEGGEAYGLGLARL